MKSPLILDPDDQRLLQEITESQAWSSRQRRKARAILSVAEGQTMRRCSGVGLRYRHGASLHRALPAWRAVQRHPRSAPHWPPSCFLPGQGPPERGAVPAAGQELKIAKDHADVRIAKRVLCCAAQCREEQPSHANQGWRHRRPRKQLLFVPQEDPRVVLCPEEGGFHAVDVAR